MPWESVIPSTFAGDAPQTADSPMDSDAFAGFYERSSRSLWAYLARVSGDPALADDLMQESYLRYLCASRPGLHLAEGEVAGRRYLFRIATNLLRDHWRRPRSASIEELPDEFLAASSNLAQADSLAMLNPALARMRPRDRQLLWLAQVFGCCSSGRGARWLFCFASRIRKAESYDPQPLLPRKRDNRPVVAGWMAQRLCS